MAKEWDYTDTYVCACLMPFSNRSQGLEHERHCHVCQRIIRGEEEPEEEDDEDN